MQPQSTGSFGAATGGISPELQAAIQSRQGNGAGVTNQVTNTSPNFNPNTQPPAPPTAQVPMPQGQPGQPPQSGQPQSVPPQMPFDPAEAKIIIGALSNRLKALSQLQGVQ